MGEPMSDDQWWAQIFDDLVFEMWSRNERTALTDLRCSGITEGAD